MVLAEVTSHTHGLDQLMRILETISPGMLRSIGRQSAGPAVIPCRVALSVKPPMELSDNVTFAQARLASEVTIYPPGIKKDILMRAVLGGLYHHPGSLVASLT
jgi:hypothetical protein